MKRRNFREYASFNKLLLNICGVLPLKSSGDTLTLLLSFTTVFCSFFVFGPGFYSLFFRWNSISPSEKLSIVREENVYVICAIKTCILIPKRDKLFKLTEDCAKLWRYVKTDQDSMIVEPYSKRGLYLSYGFAINCFLGISFCLITPLFDSFDIDANGTVSTRRLLPYSAGIFHDNVKKFYIWYALQAPTAGDSLLAIVAIDTALSFYVLHACAHMRLCRKFFQRLTDQVSLENTLSLNEVEWNLRREQFFKHVVNCVSYHKEVLKYSDDVEEIFTSVILVQTLQSITAICGYSFGALLGDETERPRSATCAVAVTIQLLLLCWPPDTLQDESMKVAHAAYNLSWYNWTAKEGRLICMIIAKSQRPVKMTARKFAIMSLQTFTWVLKMAFSVITLLRKVL